MGVSQCVWVCLLVGCVSAHSSSLFNTQLLIKNVNAANASWTAGQNFADDIPIAYIKQLLNPVFPKKRSFKEYRYIKDDEPIPEQFDSRENWPKCSYIPHIRDQGSCASGWAVAAATTFSDRYCIFSKGNFSKPFSSYHLLTCCEKCGDGCNGGLDYKAWEFFEENGIVTGGDYHSHSGCLPYQLKPCQHNPQSKQPQCLIFQKHTTPKCVKTCVNKRYHVKFYNDHRKVNNIYYLPKDTKQIQREIMKNGPVQAAFVVYEDFVVYKSGVYHQTTGNALGGHSVRIIGWGKNILQDEPYWLVANSWNTNWGDHGFFKIRRGTNECGIEDEVIAGDPLIT
ncbi:cathepsin B-like cysteine proteinase 3 [Cimex lectularius]|uniref:Peptidase C1A papain C-terminal domain-containing protein n=1 Tax=Cimex lectularius TaxID=79782 RepID=A0A8I6RI99_CIMLE|nr:cathepsin B-like cysteine proteinase 3 [Cimex lectularius]